MAGDDLMNFPTPAEAFGRNNVQGQQSNGNNNVRKAPQQQYSQQRPDLPPLHPNQSTASHPRQQSGIRPVRQYPNARPSNNSLRDQYGQGTPQPIPTVSSPASSQGRSSRNTSYSDMYGGPNYYNQGGYGSPGLSSGPSFQQQQQRHQQPVLHQQQLPHQPQPPPQQSASQILERQLRDIFDRMDRDRDGALTEQELSAALLNNDGTQFQQSTIRLMIRLFDADCSGTIQFREFYHLWNYIIHWRKTFQRYDVDQNQRISFGEYQNALESFGYRLPTDIVLFIFQKFGEFNSNKPTYLRFDMFVESLVWLLRCTNVFKKFDTQGNGIATIPFQDFVHEVISLI